MTIKYVAKKVLDNDGNIIDFNIQYRTSSNQLPNARHEILYGELTDFPKALEGVDGWYVGHDQLAEDSFNLSESNRITIKSDAISVRNALKNAVTVIENEPGLNNQTKTVLKNLLKVIRHLMLEVK